MSSRSSLMDLIEAIWDSMAIYSHLQELDHWWTLDEDAASDIHESMVDEVDTRRSLMNKLALYARWEVNNNYWCLVKHSISRWQYVRELHQDNGEFYSLLNECEEMMFEYISRYLNLEEIVYCGRCLKDMEDWRVEATLQTTYNNETIQLKDGEHSINSESTKWIEGEHWWESKPENFWRQWFLSWF